MANKWKCTVNFKRFWNSDITVEEKALKAANKLESILPLFKDDWELENIIEDFKCVSGDGTEDFTPAEDFDARMYDLYEWADANRVWITTSF